MVNLPNLGMPFMNIIIDLCVLCTGLLRLEIYLNTPRQQLQNIVYCPHEDWIACECATCQEDMIYYKILFFPLPYCNSPAVSHFSPSFCRKKYAPFCKGNTWQNSRDFPAPDLLAYQPVSTNFLLGIIKTQPEIPRPRNSNPIGIFVSYLLKSSCSSTWWFTKTEWQKEQAFSACVGSQFFLVCLWTNEKLALIPVFNVPRERHVWLQDSSFISEK